VNRTDPGAPIRKQLRAEVGFGCPVDGCGSPYLTWHHFDPPWRDGQTHNPDGMVALCLQHHKEADGGAFTNQQLRDLKTNGYMLRIGGAPGGRFNWRREQLILDAGGGFFARCPVFLEMAGRPMVWLTADDQGNQLLNLDMWDRSGNLMFSMRDNDWIVLEADDVEAPPNAKSLIVRDAAQGIRLSVAFKIASASAIEGRLVARERRAAESMRRHYKQELDRLAAQGAPDFSTAFFRERLAEIESGATIGTQVTSLMESVRRGWAGSEFVFCELRATIVFPYEVHITGSKITLPNNNTMTGAVAIDCGTAISLG
jgi:hypothetical protein